MIRIGELDFSFTAIFTSSSRATVVTDYTQTDNPIVFVNPAFTALTGYTYEEAVGRNCRFLSGKDTDRATLAEIATAIYTGVPIQRQILNHRKCGAEFWCDVLMDPIKDASSRVVGFIATQSDVTPYRLVELAKIEAEQRLHEITTHLPGFVYRRVLRADGSLDLPYLSRSINGFLGLPSNATACSEDFYKRVHSDDYPILLAGIERSAKNLTVFREELRLVSDRGEVRWVRSDANPRLLSNGDTVWDGLAIEITAEKLAQAELEYLTTHDSLTGLLNRNRFKYSLKKILELISVDTPVAILAIELCSFQEINDALGHASGDDVLRKIAQRLTEFSSGTAWLVARVGGNEFAVLLPTATNAHQVLGVAQSLREKLERPIQVAGHQLVVQVCIGISVTTSIEGLDGLSNLDLSDELLKQSAIALYSAKQRGPGSCLTYSAAFDARIFNRLLLKQSLHLALEKCQFEMYYQPIVEMSSGNIIGAEALVRWNHPELGIQSPDTFIPLAEQSGLIVALGEWILVDVIRQRQTWISQDSSPPRIAINVSVDQISKSNFISTFNQALRLIGADATRFEIELTESLVIEPSSVIREVLTRLKEMGVCITIDDFGTGHSTFKYLRNFPVDKIKIDQTFLKDLFDNSNDMSIIRSILALARSLEIGVVAEGIETSKQHELLLGEGCMKGQGYFFSPPLCAADFGGLLRSEHSETPHLVARRLQAKRGPRNGMLDRNID